MKNQKNPRIFNATPKAAKRVLAVLLTLLMLFSAVPFYVLTNAEDDKKCLAEIECTAEDHYTGNQGDSRVYRLDKMQFNGVAPLGYKNATYRNGNTSISGINYTNGFEVWIARWNFGDNISWAYRTFKLDKQYANLTGKCGIIKSYNTTDYDVTVYFYGDNALLCSFKITPLSYDKSFSVDVSGINELKVMIMDNEKKRVEHHMHYTTFS